MLYFCGAQVFRARKENLYVNVMEEDYLTETRRLKKNSFGPEDSEKFEILRSICTNFPDFNIKHVLFVL